MAAPWRRLFTATLNGPQPTKRNLFVICVAAPPHGKSCDSCLSAPLCAWSKQAGCGPHRLWHHGWLVPPAFPELRPACRSPIFRSRAPRRRPGFSPPGAPSILMPGSRCRLLPERSVEMAAEGFRGPKQLWMAFPWSMKGFRPGWPHGRHICGASQPCAGRNYRSAFRWAIGADHGGGKFSRIPGRCAGPRAHGVNEAAGRALWHRNPHRRRYGRGVDPIPIADDL